MSTLTRRISLCVIGRQKRWRGISLAGVLRMESMMGREDRPDGMPYNLYQLVLPKLLFDCFRMSLQSGAVFCSS